MALFGFSQTGNQLREKLPLQSVVCGNIPGHLLRAPRARPAFLKIQHIFCSLKTTPALQWPGLTSLPGWRLCLLHPHCPAGPWRGSTLFPTGASDSAAFPSPVSILCRLHNGSKVSRLSNRTMRILFYLTTVWALVKLRFYLDSTVTDFTPKYLYLVRTQRQAEASPFQEVRVVLQSESAGSERELFFI